MFLCLKLLTLSCFQAFAKAWSLNLCAMVSSTSSGHSLRLKDDKCQREPGLAMTSMTTQRKHNRFCVRIIFFALRGGPKILPSANSMDLHCNVRCEELQTSSISLAKFGRLFAAEHVCAPKSTVLRTRWTCAEAGVADDPQGEVLAGSCFDITRARAGDAEDRLFDVAFAIDGCVVGVGLQDWPACCHFLAVTLQAYLIHLDSLLESLQQSYMIVIAERATRLELIFGRC